MMIETMKQQAEESGVTHKISVSMPMISESQHDKYTFSHDIELQEQRNKLIGYMGINDSRP
jgi:hypothetical protein